MSEIRTSNTMTLEVPIDVAWALLADHRRDPQWRRGVIRMDPDHNIVQVGGTVVEELRLLGRTVVSTVVIEQVEDGRSFSWRVVTGADAEGVRALEPLDDRRCTLTTTKTVRLSGRDRWLRPLIAWAIRRAERGDVRRAAALVIEAR